MWVARTVCRRTVNSQKIYMSGCRFQLTETSNCILRLAFAKNVWITICMLAKFLVQNIVIGRLRAQRVWHKTTCLCECWLKQEKRYTEVMMEALLHMWIERRRERVVIVVIIERGDCQFMRRVELETELSTHRHRIVNYTVTCLTQPDFRNEWCIKEKNDLWREKEERRWAIL
jgi:hypothetical protein